MDKIRYYKVAGHKFSFRMDGESPLWRYIERAYTPFGVESTADPLFTVNLVERVERDGAELVYIDENPEPGFVKIAIYRSEAGYYMEYTQYESDIVNGYASMDRDGNISLSLAGDLMTQWMTFTNVVQVCYFIMTATLDTVMVHASAILYKGAAYLFLGRSGTGKSTHSRMWLEGVEGAELMNDDHPIIRISDGGNVIAYGSPWSGKTHCYRNVEAPVGAIVRIKQEKVNQIRGLKAIEAYGSVMSSCSGFPLEQRFSDGKSMTLQAIVKGAKCWELGCLPNVDAALVCRDAVANI